MSEPTGPAKPRTAKGPKSSQDPTPVDASAESSPAASSPAEQAPAATQPLPAAAASVPAASEAAPAGSPPVSPPSGPPPATPPGGPSGPVGPYGGGPAGPPPKGPGLWRQATSTTGGLIAVIIAAALSALLVLGVVGTLGLVAVRAAGHDGHDGPGRIERVRGDGQGLPPGQQRKLDRLPQGPDSQGRPGNGLGNDKRNGMGNGLGNGQGNGQGNGMGELMRGAMGLGNVQHGEFTVQQDGKAVVMTLQRGAVTKSSDTSVTVKSDDAFTATYVLGDDTRGRTQALAVGDTVLVVAEKAGARAVIVTGSRKG